MQVFFSERQLLHHPSGFIVRGERQPSPEVPSRAATLLDAVRGLGLAVTEPARSDRTLYARVHDAGYLDFLEHGHARWRALPNASAEILPNVHPNGRMRGRPVGIVGQAGLYMADTACPIGAETWVAACASADSAIGAARAVLAGAPAAYALCRPPGHHAFADMAGGFCYLNNVAIAAAVLRERHAKVAILDVDVHHGNGTQAIFYRRGDVFFASLHADPANYYPWFAGFAAERGEGEGAGATLNLPLAHGSGDDGVLAALDRAIAAVRGHGPGALLVSLGLDAAADDPLGVLEVTRAGFARMGRAIAALALPTVLVQEGGYPSPALGANLAAFLSGFRAAASG
jgi:acetoin utilization deacetylase AcuC-like enzyme